MENESHSGVDTQGGARRVLVWDLPTRLFHWLAAILVGVAYATWRLNWMDWHAWAGNALLSLLLFRLLWGFFGSDTARFARFIASPRRVVRHLARILRREPDRRIGHNPAGGWMVLLLIGLLLVECLTGLYVLNEVADKGLLTPLAPAELSDVITTLHRIFWDLLLGAVVVHVLAILLYAVAKRQNLVGPMFTGWKTLPGSLPPPRMVGTGRAILLFGLSILAVAGLAGFL